MATLIKIESGKEVIFETKEGAEKTLKAFPKKYSRFESVAVGKKNVKPVKDEQIEDEKEVEEQK
jgi:hypothetical protein